MNEIDVSTLFATIVSKLSHVRKMKRNEVTIRDAMGQTSKDMGANVEWVFERGSWLHTFALSKDRNNMYNNKIIKSMKKMIVALVAMFVMAITINEQGGTY